MQSKIYLIAELENVSYLCIEFPVERRKDLKASNFSHFFLISKLSEKESNSTQNVDITDEHF